jgi:hypothetical protein
LPLDFYFYTEPSHFKNILIQRHFPFSPQLEVETEIKQLILYLLDPIFHGVNMVLLLVTAIIYFVLPQLRDLLGNFVTSLSLCLIVVYAADLVRLYRGLSEHVSFLAAGRIVVRSTKLN